MAERVFRFPVAATPGTTAAAPGITALAIPPSVVDGVEIVIPRGLSYLCGIALAIGRQPVIPENAGAYIVRDGDIVKWPLDGYPNSGAWTALTYNTGKFTHTYEVVFLCSLIAVQQTNAATVAIPLVA